MMLVDENLPYEYLTQFLWHHHVFQIQEGIAPPSHHLASSMFRLYGLGGCSWGLHTGVDLDPFEEVWRLEVQ